METIGRYQLLGEVGKGAMGIVYRALDPTIGREVALKTMRLDVHGLETEELMRRFRNEAHAAGTLNHPNLVTIYDAGEHDGIFYIAMEYIQGQTLTALLMQQRILPTEQIIGIARQVCEALDYAHARGVIHRDIKPANIMITEDGTAKIMDFGIAKSGGGMTSAGQVLGTPNYMSPEQVQGKPLDGRSDLFSFGVILYEMVTGERPFMGQNVTTIIYKIVHERPIAPRDLDLTVHPGLSAVVSRAIAKSPDERYQTGAQLAHDLANYKTRAGDWAGAQALETAKLPAIPAVAPVAAGTAVAAAPAPRVSQLAETVRIAAPERVAAQPVPISNAPAVPAKSKNSLAFWLVILLVAVSGVGLLIRHFASGAKPADSSTLQSVPSVAQNSVVVSPAASVAAPARQQVAPELQVRTPAVPMTGSVRIESTPAGASVQIDGKSSDEWLTAFTAEGLKPGTHNIVIRADGYAPDRRSVEISAGKRASISAKLVPTGAVVNLSSVPSGAEVVLDGKPSAKTTPTRLTVSPGKHSFALRLQGYEEAGDVLTAAAGQSYTFNPQLKPVRADGKPLGGKLKRFFGMRAEEKGELVVRTRPAGAHVIINNVVVPGVTPVRAPLPSGEFAMTIRLPGHKLVQKRITIEKGKQTDVDEVLTPQ